jgi:ABC-type nitrate/sulfonate/bicarbonate transport system substrate-binding protein
MTIRNLSVSLVPSPFMERLLNDQALATAIGWRCSVAAGAIDANSLKMIDGALDVAEMSLATFVKAREEGFPLCCLPVFAGRGFPHSEVMAKADAGFRDMSDLRGKRVGLSQFWTTANVWRRLVLSHQYGVRQREVNWVTVNPERMKSLRLPPEARQDTSSRSYALSCLPEKSTRS